MVMQYHIVFIRPCYTVAYPFCLGHDVNMNIFKTSMSLKIMRMLHVQNLVTTDHRKNGRIDMTAN